MENPNILFIITDQQRTDVLSCYGNDYVQAPNLNRLAEESVVFENAYCTQPKCAPSRASIFTGTWPHTHGCIANNMEVSPDCRMISERLPEHYHRAYYGKWHMGDEIRRQRGFDEWVSIEDGGYRLYYSDPKMLEERSHYHHFLVSKGYTPLKVVPDGEKVFDREFAAALPEPYTKAAFLGNEASRFLREYDRDDPFFFCVSFLEPHPPAWSPFNELHDPASVPTGPAFNVPPDEDAPELVRGIARDQRENGCRDFPVRNEAEWRRLRANYYGQITLVDRAVGRILQALEESGKAENTLVVFVSDHGDMSGDHAIGKKGVTYEQAVKVPLLMRAPWLGRESRRVGGRVSLIDLAPTLLDFAPGSDLSGLQGCSRKPVLEGADSLEGEDAFLENFTKGADGYVNWRTIYSGNRWKMTLCAEDRCELYDLQDDPWEMRNLYRDPSQQGRIRELGEKLRAWQEQVADTAQLPGPE